jgi:hypothetical protein
MTFVMVPAMSEPTGTRIVCLSDDLCGCIYTALAQAYSSQIEKADEFHAAWKASPADPAEAVHAKLVSLREGERGPSVREVGWKPTLPAFELGLIADDTRAVLASLGCPAPRTPETPPGVSS